MNPVFEVEKTAWLSNTNYDKSDGTYIKLPIIKNNGGYFNPGDVVAHIDIWLFKVYLG
jgi:hypothetical protein